MKIVASALFAIVCLGVVGCGEEKKPEPNKAAASGAATAAKAAPSGTASTKPAGTGGW